MPLNIAKEVLEKMIPYGWLWALWGIAMQLNSMRKWIPFKIWKFVINIVLAVWIWYIVWSIIPESVWDMKFSLISVSGFLSHFFLDFIEKNWFKLLIKRFLWDKWDK